MANALNKALFLDRDGVINQDIGYASQSADIVFVEGIFELCQFAKQQGFLIIITTNQSGIARGYYTEQDLQQLNQWFIQQFQQHNVTIDAIYHCPHHPEITGDCDCRKPNPGMLQQAIEKFAIAPTNSLMIGDKDSDMLAAKLAGVTTRLLFTEKSQLSDNATAIIHSLNQAKSYLL